jgi:O-antigen ligase/tetratricopeptide (TPR) repeat protein
MKKIPYILFSSILIFAPLAFGTVEQWSMLTVEILIALAVLGYCIQPPEKSAGLLSVPGLVPLLLLVVWMILQITPLPVSFVMILSPASYKAYKPVYDMLEGNPWMPLTIYQKGTVLESIRIVSYIFLYVLTIQILSQGERLKQTVKICSWLAIGIAVVTILQKFTSPDKIYWFRPGPFNVHPTGPWINRSQYSGYMEMIAPLVLALTLYYEPVISSKESLRSRIVAFFTTGNLYIFLGLGFLTLILSVFISLSRGGVIALSLSFPLFFLLSAWKKSRYSGLFFIGITAFLILSLAWFGWDPIIERFNAIFKSTGELNIDRFAIWGDTLKVCKDFWLTGSGFGTFVNIFPTYKTIPGNFMYDHAHNDYLELLAEGGMIGFVLTAWFMTAVIREGWKMIGRRRDRYSILISIGALTGIVGMLIHSISDFNMHNGADGLYFFFLCGLLVSAGNTRFQYQAESTLLRGMSRPSKKHFLFAGIIFLGAVLLVQARSMLALWKYEDVRNIYLSRQLAEKHLQGVSLTLKEGAHLDPLSGMYPFLLGDVEGYLKNSDKALEYYVQAGKKNPLEGAFLQRIALTLPKDRQEYAEILMKKGAERTLRKDDLMLTQAEWLLRTDQRAKAIEVIRKGLAQNTRLVTVVIPLLQNFSFTREETVSVLPESVDAWIRYGAFSEKMGNIEEARFFYSHAFDFLAGETRIETRWFFVLHGFYRTQKEDRLALEILRLGIEKIPDCAPFHVRLGDYYAKEGITYRAKEEYQQALLLEPNNESVRNKIERMTKSEKQ